MTSPEYLCPQMNERIVLSTMKLFSISINRTISVQFNAHLLLNIYRRHGSAESRAVVMCVGNLLLTYIFGNNWVTKLFAFFVHGIYFSKRHHKIRL